MPDPTEDDGSNPSANPHLRELIDRTPDDPARRRWLQGGAGAAGLAAFGGTLGGCATAPAGPARPGFASVPISTADAVVVPRGYSARVLYAWGDPVDGVAPAFRFDASNSADDQARQAGMHHDGMAFFSVRDAAGRVRNDRGLLCINHEYVDQGLLFTDGTAQWSREKTLKAMNAHGVSVVEVAADGGPWRVVPSKYARRITMQTPMRISGPAAGHASMRTGADPHGRLALGTLNNCANGRTPWGTYLDCVINV